MLKRIIDTLKARHQITALPYLVPGLWVTTKPTPRSAAKHAVNPYDFYTKRLQAILKAGPEPLAEGPAEGPADDPAGDPAGGEWSRRALIYNLFPRVATAFDHSDDGELDIRPRPDGWRETGTLLKAIALLPYIRGMGFNTVHLLPVTAVGQDGKKGTLGSPYAIRNPYQLDQNLAEPALGLSAEDLFAGFVEAAHRLGMRVVMEFVLRTASKDGDWIKDHPEWFYWIREDVPDRAPGSDDRKAFGSPLFDPADLEAIRWQVENGDFRKLPAPPKAYRAMFTEPPRSEQVTMENGKWIGTLDDGTRVRVPGAFSDFPPDDPQPPWTDVTYLRLYNHPDFNYMAYNTLRMYDKRLDRPKYTNKALWEAIIGVIPHYQENFGIDGVMIDMGHALPKTLTKRVVATARDINPDFAFWDENFNIEASSRQEGYNAVMGYMLFDLHVPDQLRNFIRRLAAEPVPVSFFATAENHNSPRAASRMNGQRAYVYYTLPLCIAVPGIPFVHNGFELRETQPINTGVGFSPDMLAQYNSDALPLFSAWAFDWTQEDTVIEGITIALQLRRKYESLLTSTDPKTWQLAWSDNPNILAFTRTDGDTSLVFVANTDMHYNQSGRVVLGGQEIKAQGLWGTPDALPLYHDLNFFAQLSPGYVLVLEGADLPLNGYG